MNENASDVREVWIVEDDPAAAELAAELCAALGTLPCHFASPQPFMRAFADGRCPSVVVLDWRLSDELTSALYLAVRHRLATLPVIFWTGSQPEALPAVIRADSAACVVNKADGVAAFDHAIDWALAREWRPDAVDPKQQQPWWPRQVTELKVAVSPGRD